jgi:hypothetical protein
MTSGFYNRKSHGIPRDVKVLPSQLCYLYIRDTNTRDDVICYSFDMSGESEGGECRNSWEGNINILVKSNVGLLWLKLHSARRGLMLLAHWTWN